MQMKSKQISKSLKIIKRNTLQNKSYLSRNKTYYNKCIYYLKKNLAEKSFNYWPLIFKNLNLAYSALDKSQKIKILSKKTVARKKSQLTCIINSFIKLS